MIIFAERKLGPNETSAQCNGGGADCLPDAEVVRRAGMSYCWRKLGDALGVDLPIWDGEVWNADLLLREHVGVVGRLVFSRDGKVIVERSSTKQEILEGLDAQSAEDKAA
jgi:hypothetical protein